jgi:hypothetical protein
MQPIKTSISRNTREGWYAGKTYRLGRHFRTKLRMISLRNCYSVNSDALVKECLDYFNGITNANN